jgi:hypothetical protein
MCPWCRPSVDAGFTSGGILSSTIQLPRFEQRDAQATKVRNVSKVGSQSQVPCFQRNPYTTRRLPNLRAARNFIANYSSLLKFPLL